MSATASFPAVIEPGAIYRSTEVKRRFGIGDATLRKWRREGLKPMYVGRHLYFEGEAIIEHLRKTAKESR